MADSAVIPGTFELRAGSPRCKVNSGESDGCRDAKNPGPRRFGLALSRGNLGQRRRFSNAAGAGSTGWPALTVGGPDGFASSTAVDGSACRSHLGDHHLPLIRFAVLLRRLDHGFRWSRTARGWAGFDGFQGSRRQLRTTAIWF